MHGTLGGDAAGNGKSSWGLLLVTCLCLSSLVGCRAGPVAFWPAAPGAVEGSVAGPASRSGGPVVVYLDSGAPGSSQATAAAALRRSAEGMRPDLLVVGRGQAVDIVNEDALHHRYFSSTPGNAFELPALARGERQRLAFEQPGLVRIYCSLHPDEHGRIFVVPSPHYVVLGAPGPYRIAGVPPGQYAVQAWSEGARSRREDVVVGRGASVSKRLSLLETSP